MASLRDLDVRRHLDDPALKPALVRPVFDLIAPRYDTFTRVFSFGMDARWKSALVADAVDALGGSPCVRAVDLACGTGDLALRLAARVPGVRVRGVDASPTMVAYGRARLLAAPASVAARVVIEDGDMARLGGADQAVDVVTAGYAFRNGPPLAEAIGEAARVLRRGGVLATLDFYRPDNRAWRAAFLAYLRMAGGAVGWWWHREPLAYSYIAHSIDRHVTADEFSDTIRAAGLELVRSSSYLGGGIATHVARRA